MVCKEVIFWRNIFHINERLLKTYWKLYDEKTIGNAKTHWYVEVGNRMLVNTYIRRFSESATCCFAAVKTRRIDRRFYKSNLYYERTWLHLSQKSGFTSIVCRKTVGGATRTTNSKPLLHCWNRLCSWNLHIKCHKNTKL